VASLVSQVSAFRPSYFCNVYRFLGVVSPHDPNFVFRSVMCYLHPILWLSLIMAVLKRASSVSTLAPNV